MSDSRRLPQLLAEGLLVACTVVWGVTFVVIKGALTHADSFVFVALRFAAGALVALALANRHLASPTVWKRGALLGVFLFGGYWLQTEGLVHTTASRSAFLTGLTVILVPFVSWLLFARRPSGLAMVGAMVATAGLFLMTNPFAGAAAFGVGDWLTLGCALVYAFHISITERAARGVEPIAMVAVQLVVTAALAGIAALATGHAHFENTPALWWAVGFTGVIASAGAITVQTWAQARLTASRAAIVFALEPVFAAITSRSLGEHISTSEVLGGALIVLGVIVGSVVRA